MEIDVDTIKWTGILKVREVPFETEEEYLYWWAAQRDSTGRQIGMPRMSQREKECYTVYESKNTLLNAGRTQLLTYISANNGTGLAFAQYFAVGTGAIAAVQASDTTLATESFRKAITTATISGNQVTLSTYFGPSEANQTYTNAGIWGDFATSSLGTGTLYLKVLDSYTKTSANGISNDWVVVLN